MNPKLVEGEYVSKKLPYMSKSVIKTHSYFCPYLFYKTKIVGEKEEGGKMSKRMDIGTDTHMIFADFWNYVDIDYMYKNLEMNPAIELTDNPVSFYLYGICMGLVPDYDRDVLVLQRILWKFARLHAARFLYYYQVFNGNKMKVWKYFYPAEVEQFYINHDLQIFGTIDTIFRDVDDNLNEGLYIPDYKTGKVPNSVLKGPKNIADETSVSLPTKFMFECHFYGLLYLLKKGFKFRDERVLNFVLDDKKEDGSRFGLGRTKEEQQAIDKEKRAYLTKMHPTLERYSYQQERWIEIRFGDLILGIIFLTGDPKIEDPVVVKKKFGYTSLKTVLMRINTLRQIYFNRDKKQFYSIRQMTDRPEYNKYRCQNCSRNDKCLEEITNDFKEGL